MIFAAGHGTRMGKLTKTRPKPLVQVNGKPLIDYALLMADNAGIARKIVNTHYLADMLHAHLRAREDVQISHEPRVALETGGGLKHAKTMLARDLVFTLNPDAIWRGPNPLVALRSGWKQREMGALLSLVPLDRAVGHKGSGDFTLDGNGRIERFTGVGVPYVNTGAEIIDISGLQQISEDRFSINLFWDQLIANGQMYGQIYPGNWADVGTPEGIVLAETMLEVATDV